MMYGREEITTRQDARQSTGGLTIEDVKKLCVKIGLEIRSPSSGSHYVVFSERLDGALTVPAHRPIKAPYIKKLAALASTHLRTKEGK